MKFLCLDCDAPMKLHGTEGPAAGSLSVTFRCPECGFRVAMLMNPLETQMVQSLGVKVGGRSDAPAPFEHLRASMATPRIDAFEGAPATTTDGAEASGCPFAGMVAGGAETRPVPVTWTPEADARSERIPAFIRPMARRAIERYAESKGLTEITEAVMDQARGVMGME
jgi:hypothetical protein